MIVGLRDPQFPQHGPIEGLDFRRRDEAPVPLRQRALPEIGRSPRRTTIQSPHGVPFTKCSQQMTVQRTLGRVAIVIGASYRADFDVVIVWRLDRFGRSLRHIVTALDELHARRISFVSLGEGIDLSTPAGKLQLHILAALAEFERARIQERIHAGIARARAQGRRLGRKPRIHPKSAAFEDVVLNLTLYGREAARRLGVAPETVNRLRRVHRQQSGQQPPVAVNPGS
jgi:hypothetical protein